MLRRFLIPAAFYAVLEPFHPLLLPRPLRRARPVPNNRHGLLQIRSLSGFDEYFPLRHRRLHLHTHALRHEFGRLLSDGENISFIISAVKLPFKLARRKVLYAANAT